MEVLNKSKYLVDTFGKKIALEVCNEVICSLRDVKSTKSSLLEYRKWVSIKALIEIC